MITDPVFAGMCAFLTVFTAISLLGSFLELRAYLERRRSVARMRRGLAAQDDIPAPAWSPGVQTAVRSVLTRLGSALAGGQKSGLAALQEKLSHAGIFNPAALPFFLGVKVMLMVMGALCGLAVVWCGFAPWRLAILLGLTGCTVGMLAPDVWLASMIRRRQRVLRFALPDALDMLVLCTEGGTSLIAALQRVTDHIGFVHPLLGTEMAIVLREVEMGLSPGEALQQFGQRCGLEEVRELALILLQSERFGVGAAKALRTYAETARAERQQRAEERAQKAAVKIIFPTVLLIFPAIFIVLAGPAALQIARIFSR